MRFLTRIIEHIRPKETKIPFGRWRPEDCVKQMNNKIDLSNEDHCGPCGQYALEKRVSKKDKKTFTDIKKE
jgi:hypothetical protein